MSALRARIRDIEGRMDARRQLIADTVADINGAFHERMVSVGALVTAGLFGALIENRHRATNWSLLTILSLADVTVWKWFSLYSGAAGRTRGSRGLPPGR